mgnify:CR=1 FL=1
MTDIYPFAGMNQEQTQAAILYYMSAILEKLPMLNINDQAMVQVSSGNITAAVSTVSTVTTVGTISNMAGGNLSLVPYQLGAGAFHLYNNIQVT